MKVDCMIRKLENFLLVEFERPQRIEVMGQSLWIFSKEFPKPKETYRLGKSPRQRSR